MARYHVLQINPWANAPPIIADVVAALTWGLQQLGHEVSSAQNAWKPDARHVVMFPHLLDDNALFSLPPETILYNLEQIDPAAPLPPSRLTSFTHCEIWDYSQENVALWQAAGARARHMPVGWYPGLERVVAAETRDIDLLFYGRINRRRAELLNQLARAGLQVHVAQGVYGAELDALLARTRIALNLHCYAAGRFETVRVAHLLANGIPVIAERGATTEVPAAYEAAVCWAGREDFAAVCAALLDDPARQQELAEIGRAAMRGNSVLPPLADALGAKNDPAPAQPQPHLPRKARIPQILHFVWVGDPAGLPRAQIESWRRHHPHAVLRIWGNEELADIPWINGSHMQQMAGQELAGVADLMRWEILFREGGVAIDADSYCVAPLPDWLFDCEMFASWENELERPGLISNGTVGSIAANPFLMKLILDLGQQPSLAGKRAWETTGPRALTEAHRRHQYGNLTILPSHFFQPTHYTGRRYAGGGPVYADQEWCSTRQLLAAARQPGPT